MKHKKQISIKLKLTLWFTASMVILACIMFGFIALASSSVELRSSRSVLHRVINELAGEIEYDDGILDLDDDFKTYENNVYSILAEENGAVITGYLPAEGLMRIPFEHGSLREINTGGENYYLLDMKLSFSPDPDLWLRSVIPVSGRTVSTAALMTAALIMLPLLIFLAAAGGYLLARRYLKPIREIRITAESVAESGDLGRRIEVKTTDELGQLSETFNKMFDRLEENFEAGRQFTSDASHELRTPVSVILAQCEYAFENASDEMELYECIGSIQRQGYRMAKLIESLLAFTRLEQQTETISMVPTDISRIMENVCDEQSEAPENHIQLIRNIQPEIIINADATLLSRMAANLIRNAYRYGKEGGFIKVTLSKKESGVIFSVQDNGIGISRQDLPNIWNRFYRADKSRSSVKEGLGLGLSMVRQIVQMHDGSISVESQENAGSTFTVFFKNSDF
ncbi:MAG: sensor histidine kinase [Ruminococcus sp.]|jgi:signal transduction histidine kinase